MPMRLVLSCTVLLGLALPLSAQTPEDLGQVLRLDEVFEVMRDEGLAYGDDLQGELFPGSGGARWMQMVDAIYDAGRMRDLFDDSFAPTIAADPDALAAALDFFASDRGQRIVTLEIEARRAMLDAEVEEAARARADELRRTDAPRAALIAGFVKANDLVERNVSGALNANLAFYRGLTAGGAFAEPMSEAEMLAEVWAQEIEIRAETEDWIYPFLTLAYEPLPDGDLRAYVAYSQTPDGQALNAALFDGYSQVFAAISEDLGLAAALVMAAEDI